MTFWTGFLFLVGLGVYGVNQMLGMEYGHTGEICTDDSLCWIIGIVCSFGLIVDIVNYFRGRSNDG